MRFEEWEPLYEEILATFGFDRSSDEKAAGILSGLCTDRNAGRLRALCEDKLVTVCGNAPSLAKELSLIEGNVFAADGAALLLFDHGILPDAVFTDLDGAEDPFIQMNEEGSVMVVHAHGDNIPLLRLWVPRFSGPLVCTTQAAPVGCLSNWGGFTDGDRAVFAAHALGASEVRLVGFDLDDRSVDSVKHGKLMWARKLLRQCGHDI